MIATNYTDVLDQLRAARLIVDRERLQLDTPKPVRCRVEKSDKTKRGWYRLTTWPAPWGETLIVGAFGIFEGATTSKFKIELPKSDGSVRRELTDDQRQAFKRRLAEDYRRAEQLREADARRAAERAAKAWAQCSPDGESDYLARKAVQAHGVRFSPSGTLVIPLVDPSGKIHALQVIRKRSVAKAQRALEKENWPAGAIVKGHYHLIGSPQWIVLIAEGYATGATLHEATGYPVAIALASNNLAPVAAALRKRYRNAQILICADDDILRKCAQPDCHERFILVPGAPPLCPKCGKEHKQINPGVSYAGTAAVEVGCAFVVPQFPDPVARAQLFLERGIKLTDFNDLHLLREGGGLHVVRTQIEARILELGLRARHQISAAINDTGAGGRPRLRPIGTVDEIMLRFSHVYASGGAAFDHDEHLLLPLTDLQHVCANKYVYRSWMESYDRRIVRKDEVGFDPAGEDPLITCNLWGGWPTVPVAGRCDKQLDLLRHMCRDEIDPLGLFHWVLCWLAYPIKHPGAKMKTCLVVHSKQGTGKNLFFESVAAIYRIGRYSRIIDQPTVESQFNDWASSLLFVIADEVVATSQRYNIKNILKAFITGDTIRINPKNIGAYDEGNHVNVVFLSNETVPVVLDEDDRRHVVIWTPDALPEVFYTAVRAEIHDGGTAALHDFLLNYNIGEFHPGSKPFGTAAKDELINQSLDSTQRFIYALQYGDVGNVFHWKRNSKDVIEPHPVLSDDFYRLYKVWCARVGTKHAPLHRLENHLARKHQVFKARKHYEVESETGGLTRVIGPHAFFMFSTEVPEGKTQQEWLGDCVGRFRHASKEYRGEGGDE